MADISPTQREALVFLCVGGLVLTRAGWQPANDGVVKFTTQTLEALERRGLLQFDRRGGLRRRCAARITAAGRRELMRNS